MVAVSLFYWMTFVWCSAAEKEKSWPFYPPRSTTPPSVHNSERVRTDIDRFILASLEHNGLNLATDAARTTLIRRLFFTLIGLPPSPEDIQQFLEDDDPKSYEKLVDQLLQDPRFGERYARFWLDLARYADTAGYEGDPDLPYAWRYRDYVIDSFNQDKPYDLFIKEQIAGDEFKEIMGAGELPLADPEKMVAMTFLRLAPFTEPRGDETRHEMLSEMTSTVSSVFLGLTVGCAKCHDHKYDSIPTKDFYRMQAFFNTVQIMPPERGDAFQIGGPLPVEFYRKGEGDWAAKRRIEFTQRQSDFESLKNHLQAKADKLQGAGFGIQSITSGNDYYFDKRIVSDGKPHWNVVMSNGEKWDFHTDGLKASSTGSLSGENTGDWFGDISQPSHISLGQHTAGSGTPKGDSFQGAIAEMLIYDHPLSDQEIVELRQYIEEKYFQNQNESKGRTPSRIGLQFWLDASDLDANPETSNPTEGTAISTWTDKISGIQLFQDQREQQPTLVSFAPLSQNALEFDNDFMIGNPDKALFLKDQKGSIVTIFSTDLEKEGYGLEVGGGGSFISTFINPAAASKSFNLGEWINDPKNSQITEAERNRFNELRSQTKFVKQHLKRLQPYAMTLRHSFGPPYEPGVPVTQVKIRGEYDNPGETVQAGFLSCITGNQDPASIRLDPFKRWPTRSRRMALAQWIASPDNPLTARVMVNRLWFYVFGKGIVSTPSDFGKLSGGPSHPELLDWLALRFVKEKWSVKAMLRLMVTSSVFRQSSNGNHLIADEIDSENTLLWQFNRRRLEAEAIRDSILVASGRLNEEMYGLPIFPPLPEDIEERVKYSESKWATDHSQESRKRSLYIYQQRTLTMPFMQTFDGLVCEDSMPRRQISITPLQALAMYNGILVNEESRHFAKRVAKEAGENPANRIQQAFLIALGREPTREEITELKPFAKDDQSLVGLCRILYNVNEFIYVD